MCYQIVVVPMSENDIVPFSASRITGGASFGDGSLATLSVVLGQNCPPLWSVRGF